jgi:molybdate transport system substrate-binding protein
MMTRQISVISSMATRQILADLVGEYEQLTGCRVTIDSVGGVDAARRVQAGEPFDVIVLAATAMEQLEEAGRIVAGSRVAFARSAMAMAVRSGAQRPRVDDEQSVRQAIQEARHIGYSTGPSGRHLMELLDRWGIRGSISQRIVQAPPGVPVGVLVARGEADIGFQQLSELLDQPGIEVIGVLPPEIQAMTVFSAGVCSASSQPGEAGALIGYLTSPDAQAAKCRHGMEAI